MRKKEFFKKLMITVSALCLSAGFVLAAPTATISAQAAVIPGISTLENDIRYEYKIADNKLYKRLYNYSTNTPIGDWIYIRDL